jgi:N-acetyl-gamma-glutamyl-phosphate reductase
LQIYNIIKEYMNLKNKINVGIVGGTGYTGSELLRLLSVHPRVAIKAISSRSEDGIPVAKIFPNLIGVIDIKFSAPHDNIFDECDVVFFATPHGVAMEQAPKLIAKGIKVIDLGADFRLQNTQEFANWYGMEHTCPELLKTAVYGLPEINRESIIGANLIGLPGCYPTSVQLGLAPVLRAGLVDGMTLIADCKSGVSGAGRKAEISSLMAECADSFKAYAVSKGHRHQPEIVQGLKHIAKHDNIHLNFVPHLVPMIRGIHSTIYARILPDAIRANFQQLYENFYIAEQFVNVLAAGSYPETRSVKASNKVQVAVHQQDDLLIILVVEDNLVKGAAGQGVQCMNIMFNFSENAGLEHVAILP